jgi:di/tricarboxylate transporter
MLEVALLCLIVIGAIVLFVTEWLRPDLVALLILGALMLTGILSPEEAVQGFSNPATITVGCMFVLGAALDRSGALTPVISAIGRIGKGRPLFLVVVLMVAVGVASAFINNTAVVAVFLPVVTTVAHQERVSVSKLLIPLSFASQFGGVCTLIGTSTNIVVSSISEKSGYGAFGMFEMTPAGIVLFGAGIVLMLGIGYWILPARKEPGEAIDEYDLREFLAEVKVQPESPLIGRSPLDPAVEAELGMEIIGIIRGRRRILVLMITDLIKEGDLLLVEGPVERLLKVREKEGIDLKGDLVLHDADLSSEEVTLFEALVVPASPFAGRSLKRVDFRRRYGLNALAIRRTGEALRQKVGHVVLRVGDALLLQGGTRDIEALKSGNELLVLGPIGVRAPRRNKMPASIAITAGVVIAAALGVPILGAALVGAVMMILTRCLTTEEAYQSIDWKVLFVLAGVLPLGHAMTTTGAADLIAHNIMVPTGDFGPWAALAVLYLITMLLTTIMSNASAAAVLAPIAIATALALGADPRPFLMAVCFAGSTCFLTPIGYQTNIMVYGPGAYRFWDFARVGWPLNLAFWILSVYLIPKLWPF